MRGGEQTAAEMHAAKGCLIRPVPEYIEDSGKADMEFVRVMMDQLLPGKKECSIEKGLERICAYYGCGEAYILERKSGERTMRYPFPGGREADGPQRPFEDSSGTYRRPVSGFVPEPGSAGLQPDL